MTPSSEIEIVGSSVAPLAYVIRRSATAAATRFVTDDSETLQAGFVVHAAGDDVPRHVHRPIERRLVGTAEVVVVRSGRCTVDLYDDERRLAGSRELGPGDLVVLLRGGHGFTMLEDTVLFEVKQGPYTGLDEKERF